MLQESLTDTGKFQLHSLLHYLLALEVLTDVRHAGLNDLTGQWGVERNQDRVTKKLCKHIVKNREHLQY